MRKLSLRGACLNLVAILGLAWSATASCLTIDSALQSAYSNNPKFRALRLDRQNFSTKVFGSMPSVLPKVSLGHEVEEKTKWGLEWDISLGALVKPSEEHSAAQASIYNSLEQERKLLQEGTALYLDLYQAQQTLRVAKAKLDLAKKQLELTRARFSMGDATAGQIAVAEANYSSTEVEHEKSKSNIECKSEEFKNFFAIYEKVPQLSAPEGSSNAPESLEKAIALALESDYGVAAKSKEIEASRKRLRSSVFKNAPEAKFKISNTLWEKSKAATGKKPAFELSLGVKTLAPEILAENIIRKRELRKACLELQGYKAELSNRVLKLWSAYRLAKMECASAQASLEASHSSFIKTQREHGLGKGSLLDLCKAEQELENARLSQVKANVEYEKTLREMLSLCHKSQTSKKSK
jgi:outer membrane protein